MAKRARKPCKRPGCPELVESGYCEKHKKDKQQCDNKRGTASQRGYNTRWQRYREVYLRQHPVCVECLKDNKFKVEPATVVDHIVPHKGDVVLFWDTSNHQPLCKRHHDRKTASEDGGFGNYRKG